MKRFKLLLIINLFVIFVVVTLSGIFQGCTKEGPMGPAGEDGEKATAICGTCHNLGTMDTVETRYMASLHGTETTMYDGSKLSKYAGGRKHCAKCHSHQGFHETILTGRDSTGEAIPIPTKIGCETCHDEHKSLDFEEDGKDYALAYNEAVSLMITGHQKQADLNGTSNLCAYCHQPRPVDGNPDIGGDSILIASPYWGTHYGAQAVIFSGKGAFEFPGSESYENSAHTEQASCSSCHMADTENMKAGGHTMKMHNEDGSPNMAGCAECHDDANDFNIEGVQDEIRNKLNNLTNELATRDLIELDEDGNPTGYAKTHGGADPFKVSGTEAAAMTNFMLVYHDGSYGVHNYHYTKALLDNTLQELQ